MFQEYSFRKGGAVYEYFAKTIRIKLRISTV